MKLNSKKKSKELSRKKQQPQKAQQDKKIKFNLSYDNLKCFMNNKHPKTDRKRVSNRHNNNLTNTKKYTNDSRQRDAVIVGGGIGRQVSPDPSRQASNSIIQQIQKKGLSCTWNQVQETKTEYSNQDDMQQKQFLHQPFSESSSSYKKNNSHASTIDRFSGYYTQSMHRYSQPRLINHHNSSYINQASMTNSQYIVNDRNKYCEVIVFQINSSNISKDPRTTLMIKNIPNKYTIQDLSNQIDREFQNTYDFLYLPCDIKNNCNVGYGFINFIGTDILQQFYQKFHNKKWNKFRSQKICVLTYARLQGLSSLVEHFQNSKVLNHKDKRYQPIIRQMRQCKRLQSLINQQKSQQSNFQS